MDETVRAALQALAETKECVIPGIGVFRRSVEPDRVITMPNPVTGQETRKVLPGRRRLRKTWDPGLRALLGEEDDVQDGDAEPPAAPPVAVARQAIEELRRTRHTTVPGLGRFAIDVIPGGRLEVRDPFTGRTELRDEPEQRRLRFRPSAALDAVVGDRPIPEVVPTAEIAHLADAYPPGEWSLDDLLSCLERCGWRGRSDREIAEEAPALLRDFASEVDTNAARVCGPWLAEGHRDLDSHDVAPDSPMTDVPLFEVLRDGDGNRWVTVQGDDPDAFYVDHEALNDFADPTPLSRLLAAWLFHHEVHAIVGDRMLSAEDGDRLTVHLASLSPAAARERRSFTPFRA